MGKAHVLCIPSGGYGHVAPILRFCREIARKGIAFTFVAYEKDITRIMQENSNEELQSLGIRFVSLQKSDVNTVGNPQLFSQELQKAFMPVFPQLLVGDENSGMPGPTSILSDMFLFWTQGIADQLQIPRYMFVPSGCIFARIFQCCAEYFEQGKFKISAIADKIEEFEGTISMPGLPSLSYYDLPITARTQAAYHEQRCRSIWKATGVLVNSFEELEPEVLEAWRSAEHPGYEKSKVPKLYAIGPIGVLSAQIRNGPVFEKSEDSAGSRSLGWLDSQPPSSVLYVAFGSWVSLSRENISELALGLESSNQRFLWALPEKMGGSSITDVLPSGFQERVRDRGSLCIGWAPQVQILAHSATGGFLTHAGWNSSLESVAMGVPMITFPQGAEQRLNSRYLVDIAKIAFELRQESDSEIVLKQKEVERVVRLLMEESEEAKEVRSRVATFKIKAAEAVSAGGSKLKAVEAFTVDLFSDAKGP